MYYGLTSLGVVHTAISLVALGAGILSMFRNKEIAAQATVGRVYIVTTILVCLTGFPIMQHGGPGPAHALGVLTLLTLGFAWAVPRYGLLGSRGPALVRLAYSTTLLFHLVPTLAESTTRLPYGHPLFASQDDPGLKPFTGALFLTFAVLAVVQYVWFRNQSRKSMPGEEATARTA
ncbi:MAG: hypothetical protein ABW061_05805 [Polyangiaceae bacterium]